MLAMGNPGFPGGVAIYYLINFDEYYSKKNRIGGVNCAVDLLLVRNFSRMCVDDCDFCNQE